MTKIQLDYQRALEEQRHNVEAEKELEAKSEEHRAKARLTDWQNLKSKLFAMPEFFQTLADWQKTKIGTLKDIASIASAFGGE